MKALLQVLIVLVALPLGAVATAQSSSQVPEGLVKVVFEQVDRAYRLPGANLAGYQRVIIAPCSMRFDKNWLRKMNRSAITLEQRISKRQAAQVLEEVRSAFDAAWAETLGQAGYEVVTDRGAEVLEIVPTVVDLYVNAPDTGSLLSINTRQVDAGRATFVLDLRDSATGTLLGRIVDERSAGFDTDRTRASSRFKYVNDFEDLFTQWAEEAASWLRKDE